MPELIIPIIIVVSLFLVVLLLATYTYFRVFYNNPQKKKKFSMPHAERYTEELEKLKELTENLKKEPYEEVSIISFDGTRLSGRFYNNVEGAPIYISFHGYKGSIERDFSGGYKTVIARGHNPLIVDQRAHGKSGGKTITFGVKERLDCLEWIKYVNERFGDDTPIIIAGISMGGATVLMASDLELPGNVVGILSDCAYSSPKAIIKKVCKDEKLPPNLVYPFIHLGAKIFGGFNPSRESAVKSVAGCKIPILLIHGDEDLFVPYSMAKEIYESATKSTTVTLETFEGAGHGFSFLCDTERYERVTNAFVADALDRYYREKQKENQ